MKILKTIILCTFIIFLSSCTVVDRNEIGLIKLTKDHANVEVALFSYNIKDDYKNLIFGLIFIKMVSY